MKKFRSAPTRTELAYATSDPYAKPPLMVRLERVRLDRGGYLQGRYFGVGAPLYHAYTDDYEIDHYLRAGSRDAAQKALVEYMRQKGYAP